MSLRFRELLKMKRRQAMKELGLEEEDMNFIEENIGDFCKESDSQIKLVYGESCDVDQEVDRLDKVDEFMEHLDEVIKAVFKRRRYKTKKQIDKEIEEDESESEESEEDVEEEAEEEGDSSTTSNAEQEQELEQENQ